jgi:hypothetical protein
MIDLPARRERQRAQRGEGGRDSRRGQHRLGGPPELGEVDVLRLYPERW